MAENLLAVTKKTQRATASTKKFIEREQLENRETFSGRYTEAEQELITMIYSRASMGRRAREPFVRLWDFWQRLAKGFRAKDVEFAQSSEDLDFDAPSFSTAEFGAWADTRIIFNKIYSSLQFNRAFLQDSMPIPQARPKHRVYQEIADQIDLLLQYVWEEYNVPRTASDCLIASQKFGHGVTKVWWDYNDGPRRVLGVNQIDEDILGEKLGDLRIEYRHPIDIMFPLGEPEPRRLRWTLDIRYDFVLDIEDQYENGKFVQPEPKEEGFKIPEWIRGGMGVGEHAGRAGDTMLARNQTFRNNPDWIGPSDEFGPMGKAVVFELWTEDDTTEEIEVEGGGTERAAKYPHGRLIVVSGGIILFDGPSPHYLGEKKPFSYVTLDPIEGEIYGESTVAIIYKAQEYIEEILSLIRENMILTGDDRIVAATDTFKKDDVNGPGRLYEFDPQETGGVPPHFQPGMPIDPTKMQHIQNLSSYIDEMLGIFPAIVGQAEFSGESGIHAERNRTSASVRLNEKKKFLNKYLVNVGAQALDRLAEHWEINRKFTVFTPDGQRIEAEYLEVMRNWREFVDLEVQSTFSMTEEAQFEILLKVFAIPGPDGLPSIDPEVIISHIPALRDKPAILRDMQLSFVEKFGQRLAALVTEGVIPPEEALQQVQQLEDALQQLIQQAEQEGVDNEGTSEQ